MSILDDKEIPVGLGMALAQNLDALNAFSALDAAAKNELIARSKKASSRADMQQLVDSLPTAQ